MALSYHIPVLCEEVGKLLITNRDGIYLDGTLGGGGHAEYILDKLSKKARYIALDLDREALDHARKRLSGFKNVELFQANFRVITDILAGLDITKIDGLFLDLGVSSYQIDRVERGFSYLNDGQLDMRMDQDGPVTAGDVLNTLPADKLKNIFSKYGEERWAGKIANLIVSERKSIPLSDTRQLRSLIDRVVHPRYAIKSYARVFQALRIFINDELNSLAEVLSQALNLVRSGGRIAVIAYHSLEDRIVKNTFKSKANPCVCPPEFPKCMCGLKPQIRIITKKPIKPDPAEVAANRRARSALLRVGEVL